MRINHHTRFSLLFLSILLTLVLLAVPGAALAQAQSDSPAANAPAAMFVIETNVAEVNPGDGDCSLHEAITNINLGVQIHPNCPTPDQFGTDTIDLDGRTIAIETPANGINGYTIDNTIGGVVIEGNGGGIKNGTGACDGANGGLVEFRLFTLSVGASLQINDTTLSDGCLLNGNGDGGIIFVDGSAMLEIASSTLSGNKATKGGAIYNNGGMIKLTNSTLAGNEASDDGGGIYSGNGTITIGNSTVSGNTAVDNGGGLMVNGGSTLTLVNSTLHGNTAADWGGGIIIGNGGGTVDLYNSTITNNTGTLRGGGVYRNQGTYNIYNSIISGNLSNGNDECHGTYSSSVAINSVFGVSGTAGGCSGFATETNVVIPNGDISTVFMTSGGTAVLADNGGATETVALIAGSPAWNAGANSQLPDEGTLGIDVDGDGNTDNPIDEDQRGAARIVPWGVDAGAYELNCDGYTFPYTLGASNRAHNLRMAITCANESAAHDTIDLNGQTVTFGYAPEVYDYFGHNALPRIVKDITIQNGILERDSNLNNCDGGSGDRTEFRLLLAGTGGSIDVTLNDLTFRHGCASDVVTDGGGDDYGAAVLSVGTVLRINKSHFENNNATQWGGAIYAQGSTAFIANSSFINNTGSGGNNGIIWATGSATTITIVNSTISDNNGNAVYNNQGTTHIINSTIRGNNGVGVRLGAGTLVVHNTILANNGGNNCVGNAVTSSHSYSDDNTCNFAASNGTDNATIGLGSLSTASNGTMYYPLLYGDPVNGGSNALLPGEATLGIDVDGDGNTTDYPIEADQRGGGYARIGYGTVDAGAYEALALDELTVVKDGTGSGTVTSDPAGIDCGSSCTLSLAPSSVITLTAVADGGSAFNTWSGACTGFGPCQLTITETKTVTATFTTVTTAVTPTLSITNTAGMTTTLGWTTDPANCSYAVYSSTMPYADYTLLMGGLTGNSYAHDGGIGNPAVNNFYYVQAIGCPSGPTTAVSNTVGEFDFAIVPGN